MLKGKELEFFLKFNRNIFKQRRKTLVNNISASYSISKEEAGNILEEYGFSKTIRSEVLSVEEIVKLSKIFKERLS
jgi:16S rRNA A1518/A1519 N6-dimethyltransferase RsmA/KsgA/DIM1 with predicted DNA glycosylase/AP lyase activity